VPQCCLKSAVAAQTFHAAAAAAAGAAAAAAQVAESELDKKGDGYVLKSDPSIKVHARAHKVRWLTLSLDLGLKLQGIVTHLYRQLVGATQCSTHTHTRYVDCWLGPSCGRSCTCVHASGSHPTGYVLKSDPSKAHAHKVSRSTHECGLGPSCRPSCTCVHAIGRRQAMTCISTPLSVVMSAFLSILSLLNTPTPLSCRGSCAADVEIRKSPGNITPLFSQWHTLPCIFTHILHPSQRHGMP
jgi:hypothetical protein